MLDENLSRYIWKHTRAQQLWILVIVALSMIPYFMSFNLPKQIVNGPIQGDGFGTPGATQLFMQLQFDLPWLGQITLFPGIELDRINMLFALSGVFLLLVIINGAFKFYINTYKGRLGERLLRRMRFSLIDSVLRFPPAAFKRMKAAEVASMVKDEVEPIGGFTGDAFVAPALLGGQALTALTFIFIQSVPLGMITLTLVAAQALVIPRMRRRLLVLGRERQLTARELAGRVSEIFDGIGTIHSNDTSNYERADIAARLGRIFRIRFDIYQWKFLVKFINNFLASVTPFLFYAVGGYLALNGRLDIGQLVAVIAAYKDLPGPLKELIDWDQNRQDVQVKYQTVTQQFAVDGLIDPQMQAISNEDPAGKLTPPLTAVNLGVMDEGGTASLEHVNFSLDANETVAVVGNSGAGGDVLAEAMARLVWPSSGRIAAGGTDLQEVPESVTGRAITYVGPDAFFFYGTVRDNMLYVLKNAPSAIAPPKLDAKAQAQWDWEREEAALAGNPFLDLSRGWIDFQALGVDGPQEMPHRVLEVLQVVGLSRTVFDLALRTVVDLKKYDGLAEKVVELRQALRTELQAENLDGLIVPFEPDTYNTEATVIENLLFGNAQLPDLMSSAIVDNDYFRKVMAETGLRDDLFAMGMEIARNAIELFSDLPPDHPFFQQLTFMSADDIPIYQSLLQKLDNPSATRSDSDLARMIRLSFDYIEPRHRFGLLSDDLKARIVSFRHQFHDGLPARLRNCIERYDAERYIASSSLLDNILFGRISEKYRDGAERIYTAAARLLEPAGLNDVIVQIGLDFHIGTSGKLLTQATRQRLGLARALLRRSDYYIFNRSLSTLDTRAQETILKHTLEYLHRDGRNPAIMWVISNPAFARHFDRVAVFDRGLLIEEGSPDELIEKNGFFNDLITA